MTWKEFKDRVESFGVKDDDRVNWIDMTDDDVDRVEVFRDEDGSITVH